jgi:hypothetical protein
MELNKTRGKPGRTFTTPGTPDLLLVSRGKMALMELKEKDGRLSHDQIDLHALIEEYGGTVLTGFGFEDAIRTALAWSAA